MTGYKHILSLHGTESVVTFTSCIQRRKQAFGCLARVEGQLCWPVVDDVEEEMEQSNPLNEGLDEQTKHKNVLRHSVSRWCHVH